MCVYYYTFSKDLYWNSQGRCRHTIHWRGLLVGRTDKFRKKKAIKGYCLYRNHIHPEIQTDRGRENSWTIFYLLIYPLAYLPLSETGYWTSGMIQLDTAGFNFWARVTRHTCKTIPPIEGSYCHGYTVTSIKTKSELLPEMSWIRELIQLKKNPSNCHVLIRFISWCDYKTHKKGVKKQQL